MLLYRATIEELRQHPWLKPEVEKRRFTDLHPAPSTEDLSRAMLAPRPMTMVQNSLPACKKSTIFLHS